MPGSKITTEYCRQVKGINETLVCFACLKGNKFYLTAWNDLHILYFQCDLHCRAFWRRTVLFSMWDRGTTGENEFPPLLFTDCFVDWTWIKNTMPMTFRRRERSEKITFLFSGILFCSYVKIIGNIKRSNFDCWLQLICMYCMLI